MCMTGYTAMPRLVCFGDSITQGNIGTTYVTKLAQALPSVEVLNRGIDGDTTFNLLKRLDNDVIAARPDVVSIMVGLNDFGTAYGEPLSRLYYRFLKKVPIAIDIPVYEAMYAAIIERLLRLGITVVLYTPTTLGEMPDTPGQALLDGYVDAVRRVAQRFHLPLVDVRAAFVAALRQRPFVGPEYHLWRVPLDDLAIKRGATYETIARRRGYQFLVDGVHLSDAGATLVAQTVLPTLCQLLQIDTIPTLVAGER